ncbi:hypothetical protein WICMUC_005108 [Wickerhamomyces mucosus]|uniref:Iron transporter FTH1 n=1 Tax=Wickerhamomyces mucosus TaxID=1378264 RepID=A0A9P8T7D0_9ASCO|nr:hypothetical protein WICMUC_005108 [Wickerhamomyces mucosus]
MQGSYFSFKVFFVLLRETFESAVVISILLSFLKQNFTEKPNSQIDEELLSNQEGRSSQINLQQISNDGKIVDEKLYNSLRRQVWFGAIIGFSICALIGTIFVILFYLVGENYWTSYEKLWEAIFSVVSSLVISFMGVSLLRINQMQRKWQVKLSYNMRKNLRNQSLLSTSDDGEDRIIQNELGFSLKKKKPSKTWKVWIKKKLNENSLMVLPLLTLLREGLEAIFVITGVTASEPVSSLPLSIISAMILGTLIGLTLYKGGNKLRLQIFLIGSTCFLYLVSAGLMSRGVWFFELDLFIRRCNGQDMAEVGNGPGSYDIANTIWHVNCCSGMNDGGWMLLNALVGWTNTATYGSILSYNLYWLFIVILLKIKLYQERHGYLPFIPFKWQLKKIEKRFNHIKFNLDYNENYKSTTNNYKTFIEGNYNQTQQQLNLHDEISGIELYKHNIIDSQNTSLIYDNENINEHESDVTTSLLSSRGTT